MTISVLIADDHAIFREGLRTLLKVSPEIQVLAEANNGSETLSLSERFKPDVIVLDWVMPGMGGLEVTKYLAVHQPQVRIVVVSMHADDIYVSRALQNGAKGYILKEDVSAHLAKAINAAVLGKRYLSPTLKSDLILMENCAK